MRYIFKPSPLKKFLENKIENLIKEKNNKKKLREIINLKEFHKIINEFHGNEQLALIF